jgi:hypothetical protein
MRVVRGWKRLRLPYFDVGGCCNQDDKDSYGKGDDDWQEGRIAFTIFRGWVVVGRVWLRHEVLDAGASACGGQMVEAIRRAAGGWQLADVQSFKDSGPCGLRMAIPQRRLVDLERCDAVEVDDACCSSCGWSTGVQPISMGTTSKRLDERVRADR